MGITLHDLPTGTQGGDDRVTWRYALRVAGESILVGVLGYLTLCLLLLF